MHTRSPGSHQSFLPSFRYLLLVSLLLVSNLSIAQSVYESTPMFRIKATPKVVDEGDVVNFELYGQEYVDKSGKSYEVPAHASWIIWNFGVGMEDTALGLNKISHRFINGDNSPQTVRATHHNETKELTVLVNNVKPKIYRMWHSTPVVQGQPVKFHALATDPGLTDVLTFNWDFGDGFTATGPNVEHSFSGNGDYQVTLKVDDTIAFDIKAIDVDVGWKNSFVVSGGVSLPKMSIDTLVLAASTKNPMAAKKTGACQIRLEMSNQTVGASFALTANLDPGFGEREYNIGETTEWGGSHEDDVKSQGTFFGELGLDASMAYRDFSGTKVGGPFWSQDGKVTIHKFDGKQLELSFSADILEMTHIDYNPREIKVEGYVSTAVETSTDGVFKGIGDFFSAAGEAMQDPDAPSNFKGANFYLCGQEEPGTFDIASWNPFNNEIGVEHHEPQIEVTFTEQVDPESLVDNAHLEVRGSSEFRPIPGGWEVKPDDPKTIRFIPKAYLLPAMIYCIRIDANEDGLKSTSGALLKGKNAHGFSKSMRPACENSASTAYGSNTRRSAFSTRVEFSSVRVDLYQASLVTGDTDLVPNKPTMARVFPYWSDYAVFHPSARVKQIDAKVSVSGNVDLPYQAKEVKIKRPDKYTSLQKREAENSINFFGWRPADTKGDTEVFAIIEQLDQAGVKIEPSHESEKTVVHTWPHKLDFKQLKIQPYFIHYQGDCTGLPVQGCDWRNGISAFWKKMAQRKLSGAMEFTTQNFPFVSTVNMEDQAEIPPIKFKPPSAAKKCTLEDLEDFYCYNVGLESEVPIAEYVGDLMFDMAGKSDADILLGIVPPGFFPPGSVIGLQTWDSKDRPLVYAQLDEANAATITHEFGHFFELDHCPPGEDDEPCYLNPVQGYRMNLSGKRGFSKHHIDGNHQAQKLNTLMHPKERPVNEQFISVSQYRKLMNGIHAFKTPSAFMPTPAVPTPEPSWLETLFLPASAFAQANNTVEQQQLIVSGVARNGKIQINRTRMLPSWQIEDYSTVNGPYNLEVRNADGSIRQTYTFDLNKPKKWHGKDIPTSSFRVSVPALADLHSIHITGPGGATAQVLASPNKPTVTARVTTNSASGLKTLHWSAADADGDALKAMVYLKGGEGEWYGVAADLSDSQLELPAHSLPAAKSVSARIIISDGLNSASTELDIGAGAPLSVLVANPEDGATEVDVMSEISAWISSPLLAKDSGAGPVALPSGKFTLSDPAGKTVPATVSYLGPERIITLTPDQPLEPASRYQVSLAGIKDRWNNPLAPAHNWSFETGPEEVDPEIQPEFDDLPDDDPPDTPESPKTSDGPTQEGSAKPAPSSSKAQTGDASTGESDATSSGECSCACSQRAFADELCELFCEDEFAACKSN